MNRMNRINTMNRNRGMGGRVGVVGLVGVVLCLGACSGSPLAPAAGDRPPAAAPAPAPPAPVTLTSAGTGQVTIVQLSSTDPQPPTCAWRDLVVRKHIAWGGSKNDIVTLSNGHKVYIWDIGPGQFDYELFDNPTDWCVK